MILPGLYIFLKSQLKSYTKICPARDLKKKQIIEKKQIITATRQCYNLNLTLTATCRENSYFPLVLSSIQMSPQTAKKQNH